MKIWLIDKQCWFLVTLEEAKRIVNSGLTEFEFTRENIQQYLLY